MLSKSGFLRTKKENLDFALIIVRILSHFHDFISFGLFWKEQPKNLFD